MKSNPAQTFVQRAVLGISQVDDCCYYCDEFIPKGSRCVILTLYARDVSFFGRRVNVHMHPECWRKSGSYPQVKGLENPTLRIPIKSSEQLQHIHNAQRELNRAGVSFDTGTHLVKPVEKHWELDWSLKGARLKNPLRCNPPLVIEVKEVTKRGDVVCQYCPEQIKSGEKCIAVRMIDRNVYGNATTVYIHIHCWEKAGRYPPLYMPRGDKRRYPQGGPDQGKLLENPQDLKKKAVRFRKLADSLQKQIDSKRHPAIAGQNLTRRRASIIESMARDAYNLERIQSVLRGMADDIDAGKLPAVLANVNNKALIDRILSGWYSSYETKMTEGQFLAAKVVADAYVKGPSEAVKAEQAKRKLEFGLIGTRMPGFFPTPPNVVRRLIELSKPLYPALKYLEPSAGKGDIADALKWAYGRADMDLTLVEISSTLIEILKAKGYKPIQQDFLTFTGGPYDRIIMNPPFEHAQDVAHVRHAYDLLAPGGRLVSVMGAHPFFGKDKIAIDFRFWLRAVVAKVEDIPKGSFTGAKVFRQTGTAGKIVTINKPRKRIA